MIGEDFSMNTKGLCKNNKVPCEICQVKYKQEIHKNRKLQIITICVTYDGG